MAGLLDNITEDQMIGGLLGAGAASGSKGNFLSRMAAGMGAGENFKRQRSQEEMQKEYKDLTMKKMRMEMEQAQRKATKEQSMIDMAGKFSRPALPGMGGFNGSLPPEMQVPIVPGQQAGYDYTGYANALAAIDPMKSFDMQQKIKKPVQKFSTTPQQDQSGRMYILADDGSMKYLDGVSARDKLISEDLAGKKGFRTEYSPEMIGMVDKFQTPDGIARNDTSRRGQDMTDSRARDFNATAADTNAIRRGEKAQIADLTKNSQVASFDTMLGTLGRLKVHPGLSRSVGVTGMFPTMPGSESANFQAELDTFQSQAFIPMVAQLKGMGALSDAEGRKLTAAVGALNPRMGEAAFRASVDRIIGDMNAARARLSGVPTAPKNEGATGSWGGQSKSGWSIQKE